VTLVLSWQLHWHWALTHVLPAQHCPGPKHPNVPFGRQPHFPLLHAIEQH
jgi:hypothetical protein